MAIFDGYIWKLADRVAELRQEGNSFREWQSPPTAREILAGLPVGVGQQASQGIVLRSDTHLELGSPEAGSCHFILWTDSPSLIRDGQISLIGPDIPSSGGLSLPFGQFIVVGGRDLDDQDHQRLEQSQIISDQIEGYMIKSTSDRMWSRVSKSVAARGFSFETLGQALMALVRSQMPKVEAMEVLFVTSGKADVARFEDIATQVHEMGRNIRKDIWKARGYDIECTLGGDCGSCSSNSVCNDIREMVSVRKQRIEEAVPIPA